MVSHYLKNEKRKNARLVRTHTYTRYHGTRVRTRVCNTMVLVPNGTRVQVVFEIMLYLYTCTMEWHSTRVPWNQWYHGTYMVHVYHWYVRTHEHTWFTVYGPYRYVWHTTPYYHGTRVHQHQVYTCTKYCPSRRAICLKSNPRE